MQHRRIRGAISLVLTVALAACTAPVDEPSPSSDPAATAPAASAVPSATPVAVLSPSVEPGATPVTTASPGRTATATSAPAGGWVGPQRVGTRPYDELSLVLDKDGVAHAAAELNDAIFYLTNASGRWTRERVTTHLEGGSDREPSIAYDPVDGYLSVAFTRYSRYECFELGCYPADSLGISVLNNYGSEWSQPIVAARSNAVRPVLRIGNAGDHLAYELVGRRNTWVHHASPYDPGPTWNDTRLGVGHSPSLQVGSDDLPRIAFIDEGVFYAVAESPAGPFDVEPVPGVAGWPELLLGDTDQPHIVYTGWDEPWSILHTTWNGSSWTASTVIAADQLVDEAAIDAGGAIHLIYDVIDSADEDDQGLWYATNRAGAYEAVQIDQSTRAAIDGPAAASALAIDSLGRPHVLYVVPFDDGRNGLYYAIGPGG